MSTPNETLEQAVLAAANQADNKGRQVAAVSKLVDMNLVRNRETIGDIVTQASQAAKKKAEEVQHIVGAWGDDAGDFSRAITSELRESLRLMNEQGFENADIVFITDGECALGQEAIDVLRRQQEELRFTITGVLLDADSSGMDFSLKTFCQKIYRTSDLTGDAIVSELVTARV